MISRKAGALVAPPTSTTIAAHSARPASVMVRRQLRPERSDMAVVAETEDAEIEGLGGRANGPGGLVGGRGFDRRQFDRPSETAGGGNTERIEHAAGGMAEVGVIGRKRHAALVAHVPVDAGEGLGRERAGADHPGVEGLRGGTAAEADGGRSAGREGVDAAGELGEGFFAGEDLDRAGGSGEGRHGGEDRGPEHTRTRGLKGQG